MHCTNWHAHHDEYGKVTGRESVNIREEMRKKLDNAKAADKQYGRDVRRRTNIAVSPHPSYQFPKGVNTIHIEIYDERTLTDDELIAWVNLPIPETIFQVKNMKV